MIVKLEKWHTHVLDFCSRHPDLRFKLSIENFLLLCKYTYVQDEEESGANVAVNAVSAKDDFIKLF